MISVAICTFNRAESLRRTLVSLAESLPPMPDDWEVIVVDNNSSDGTRAVVVSFEDRLPISYVFEGQQGLSAARNRALRVFRGDLLLFTDDDVVVDAEWLSSYRLTASRFPTAGFFGGRIFPSWPHGKPRWLKDENLALISGLLVRFQLGGGTREFLPSDPSPFGASFGLRRKLIEQCGEFRRDLGVNGVVPGRGEETEYLDRARTAGWSGVYVADAIAHHVTDPSRLTLRYMYRYGLQSGMAMRQSGATADGAISSAALYAFRGMIQLLIGRGDRFRQCVINMGVQMALRRSRRVVASS